MLTPEQCESYQRDGYLLVPNLFSKEQLAPALEVAEQNAYGKSLEAFNAEIDAHPEIAETLIRPKGRRSMGGPRAQFHDIPTGIDAIDQTIEHEPFLDALSQLLDTPDMHYHHGFVYVRSGRLDRRTPQEPWQGFHIDWAKPLLPPHPEWQRYGHIQAWVYLTDNDPDCAPVRVLPGAHSKMNKLIRNPLGTEHSSYRFDDIRELPFKFEPITAEGKTGTVLFYSSHNAPFATGIHQPEKTTRRPLLRSGPQRHQHLDTHGKTRHTRTRTTAPLLDKNHSKSSQPLWLAQPRRQLLHARNASPH